MLTRLNGEDKITVITYPRNDQMLDNQRKTIVCGHWHTSYGHCKYEGKGSEFGRDADFSPYYAPGIIALDACTARSGQVNVITLDD